MDEHDEQRATPDTGRPRGRIRMPVEDRVSPEDWVAEQPDDGVSASQQAESNYQAARRRFETEYGVGG